MGAGCSGLGVTAPIIGGRVELRSVITCPHCGAVHAETMPLDACLFFYECPACHVMLRPKAGDCCVFCSFGSVPCPPVQQAGCGCAAPPHES